MSYLHKDHQLFLFMNSWERLVFVAVHPDDINTLQASDFLMLTRRVSTTQALHKRVGGISPFAAPTTRIAAGEGSRSHPLGAFYGKLRKLRGDYWGVVALEVFMKDVTGLDYINTLVSFGSRLALETKAVRRLWFRSAKEFCLYYDIPTQNNASPFYRPVLSRDETFFVTKQLYPSDTLYPRVNSVAHARRKSSEATLDPDSDDDQLNKSQGHLRVTADSQEEEDDSSEISECQPPFEYLHKNQMLMAYFDDPVFPFLMKELLKNRGNKPLLRMYERGLPSWAMFLPSYGLPYRPWMRRVMTVVIFLVSLITMLLGFYDLYKNIPLLRETLQHTFGSLYQWLEDACAIRLGCLLTWIVSSSQIFQSVITYPLGILWPQLGPIVSGFISIADYVGRLLVTTVTYLVMLLKGILWVFGTVLFAVRRVFTLPIDVSWGFLSLIWNFIADFYRAVANVFSLFRSTGGAVTTATQATSIFTDIKVFWQDIFRNVLKGITAIYNFTVYSCCNLYKYKDSTIMTLDQYYRAHYNQVWSAVQLIAWFAVAVFISILLYELLGRPSDLAE